MDATSFTSPDSRPSDITGALAGAGFEVAPPEHVRRTLLDTFDGRLHAAGLRLEVREAGGLHLLLTGKGAAPARVAAAAVPRLAGDLPAGPFRARLAPVLGVRALMPVVTMTARHIEAVQRDGAGKVRATVAVYDRLAVEDGRTPDLPAWATEVGRMAGYAKAAERASELLCSLGLRPAPGDVVDLVVAAAGLDLRGFAASPTVALRCDEPAISAVRRVLANLAGAVDANWQGTVDDVDPEFLHDLRVAVRRTRSVLAQARRVLPAEVRVRYREGFSWLGSATGPARDLDVYAIEWGGYVAPLGDEAAAALLPVLDHIVARRGAEHAALGEVLRSAPYGALLSGWRAWLDDPTGGERGPKEAGLPVGEVAADRIARAQDQLVGRGRAIDDSTPAEELHELRKDAKKLRYLLECFGGLYAPAPRKAFVQRLKALQDNLGTHQDAEVHAAQLRAFSAELYGTDGVGPDTMVAMGQLTESLERRRRSSREEFAQRFAAYDTKQTRRSIQELLHSAGR